MISLPALAAGAWTAALLVVPVAIIAAGCLRVLPCRPATRHAIWAALLLVLLVLPVLPPAPTPSLVRAVTTVAKNDAVDGPSLAADADAAAAPDLVRDPESAVDSSPESATASDAPSASATDAAASIPAPAPALSRRAASAPVPAGPRLPSPATERPPTPSVRVPAAPSGPDVRAAELRPSDRPSSPRVWAEQNTPSEPAMRRPRDLAGFAAPLAGTPTERLAATEPPTTSIGPPAARSMTRPPAAAMLDAPRVAIAPDPASPGRPERPDRVERPTAPARAASPERPAADAIPGPGEGVTAAAPGPETQAVQVWLSRVRDVRDALVRVPLIPTSIWAAGAATVALVALIRCVAFRRRLGRAVPADGATRGLVLAVAQDCGIERAPEVRMTTDATSPLLWCGPGERPLLVLPTDLWSELDSLGRRAVVAHELAHLRRRDHIGCWLSLLVGCLYWWHPVVWFVRRRLEEEADHCCDAWVTTLLPEARRAYATALLRARAMSSGSVHAPGPAMTLTTTRTRRFARRLTMVMSRTTRPNASVGGALLAVGLAAGSWLASPALACPPDEKGTASAPAVATIGTVRLRAERTDTPNRAIGIAPRRAPVAPQAPRVAGTWPARVAVPVPPTPSAPPALPGWAAPSAPAVPGAPRIAVFPATPRAPVARPSQGIAAFPGDVAGEGQAGRLPQFVAPASRGADAARLEVLEARMSRMEAMLERLVVAVEGGRAAAPVAPRFPEGAVAIGAMVEGGAAPAPATEILIQSEKGEAFWALLARDDVAIQVSRDGDRIIVLGPERNGMLAEAFAAMVTSDEKAYRRMDIAPQHVDAVWEFMARSDVPVWIRRDGDGIAVEGTPLEHLVFEGFAQAMVGDGGTADPAVREYAEALRRLAPDRAETFAPNDAAERRALEMMMAQRAHQEAAEAAGQASIASARALNGQQRVINEHRIAVERLRLAMSRIDVERTQAQSQYAQLETEAEQLERHADHIEERADQLESEWDEREEAMHELELEMEDVAEAGGEDSRDQLRTLRRTIRDMKRRMEQIEREAGQLDQERDHLESRHEDLERAAEALEDQADELEDARDELMERLEEMEEELVEVLQRGDDVLPGMIDEQSDECDAACDAETTCASERQ